MAVDIWSQSLKEAYAAAPSTSVILNTIELHHESFLVGGVVTPIRMVADPGELISTLDDGPDIRGLYLKLESTAPVNPSATVLFQSVMFKFKLPEQTDSRLGTMQIVLDNVTHLVSDKLDKAVTYRSPMTLIYREYLADTPTTPQVVIPNLSIKSVNSTILAVTATANFMNFIDKKFPNKEYRPDDFPGLSV